MNYLSQCPDCAGRSDCGGLPGGDLATCIECGAAFLMPIYEEVPEAALSGPGLQVPLAAIEISATTAAISKWKSASLATAFSLLFNTTIIVVLGFCFFAADFREPNLKLEGKIVSAEQPEDFDFFPVLNTGGVSDQPEAIPEPALISQVTTQVVSLSESGEFTLPAGVSGLAGGGAGGGQGQGRGLFSGTESAGSFAYVVDASGSMDGSRMRLVLLELSRSIRALRDTQNFFVVFFSDRTFPMMWPRSEHRLIAANRVNQKRVLDWAFSVRPDSGTNPTIALKQALKLRPDIVYFLTDGQIPPTTIDVVRQHRKDPTVVHTISVGSRAAREMMQQIALTGGGVFTDVR